MFFTLGSLAVAFAAEEVHCPIKPLMIGGVDKSNAGRLPWIRVQEGPPEEGVWSLRLRRSGDSEDLVGPRIPAHYVRWSSGDTFVGTPITGVQEYLLVPDAPLRAGQYVFLYCGLPGEGRSGAWPIWVAPRALRPVPPSHLRFARIVAVSHDPRTPDVRFPSLDVVLHFERGGEPGLMVVAFWKLRDGELGDTRPDRPPDVERDVFARPKADVPARIPLTWTGDEPSRLLVVARAPDGTWQDRHLRVDVDPAAGVAQVIPGPVPAETP